MNVLEWMICSGNNCTKEYKFLKKEGGGDCKRCILLCILFSRYTVLHANFRSCSDFRTEYTVGIFSYKEYSKLKIVVRKSKHTLQNQSYVLSTF